MKHTLYVMGINWDGTDDDWIRIGEYTSWRRLEQAKSGLVKQDCYKNRAWKSVSEGATND